MKHFHLLGVKERGYLESLVKYLGKLSNPRNEPYRLQHTHSLDSETLEEIRRLNNLLQTIRESNSLISRLLFGKKK